MILKKDGSVWSTTIAVPALLSTRDVSKHFSEVIPRGAIAVAAGSGFSLVLKRDGSVWATGSNRHGQLGDGSTTDKSRFIPVIPGGAEAVAAGSEHSMVLQGRR